MHLLILILLIFAYTLGIVTVFVELICYSRKIEYRETILLTLSFLFLIMAVTIDHFFDSHNSLTFLSVLIQLAMIALALTTVLNVYKERDIKMVKPFKQFLLILSATLFLGVFVAYYIDQMTVIEYLVGGYLISAVIYAMYLVRTTKPTLRIKYRERIERITALVCIIVLPISLVIDYFQEYIPWLNLDTNNPIKITLPLLFIFIALGKLIDDIKRLSLFNPENNVTEQNIKNYNFTKREMEIVHLIIKGATYNEISEKLFISLPTVKTHVSNVYRKAEVNNKVGLINLLTNP